MVILTPDQAARLESLGKDPALLVARAQKKLCERKLIDFMEMYWGVLHPGKVMKRGVRLWFVGTDTAKDLLFGRLMGTQPGPGYVHFSTDLPPDFYRQLTAEARIPQRTARGIEYRWVNPKRARNEVLDCTVYAIFCAHQMSLNLYTDKMWQRLEDAVQPPNADLFAVALADDPADDVGLPAAPLVQMLPPKKSTARPRGRFGASGNPWS